MPALHPLVSTPLRRTVLALAVVVAGGAARLSMEERATRKFQDEGLLSAPLELDLREKIGQNSSAIALSGLRTLVATFAHLQATEHFSDQRWPDLESSMETAVQLAPRSAYYWDMGAWHMAYNAASYYRLDSDLPPARAEARARAWVEKGRNLYRRGIANNPGDWQLPSLLGQLLSDGRRFPDDRAAVEAFRLAVGTGNAPPHILRQHFMAEARAASNPAGLLDQVRHLLEIPGNRVPTLLCLRYTLEYQAEEPADPAALAVAIFGSEERALRNLGDYHVNNVLDRMPERGVEAAIRLLEGRRDIPPTDKRSSLWQRESTRERLGVDR